MKLHEISLKKSLNKAYRLIKPKRPDIELFKGNLIKLLGQIDEKESEENVKIHLMDFLKDTWYKQDYLVATKGRTDFVIHTGKEAKTPSGVLFEVKRPTNKGDMVTRQNLNAKAMHELILYYLRERVNEKNIDIRHLVITNIYEWFIFDASVFEKAIAKNTKLLKAFKDWDTGQKVSTNTDLFYKEIAKPFLDELKEDISFTWFDIREYEKPLKNNDKADDNKLIALFKIFSPIHLLKIQFANDSNSLDKGFYSELLHIIGLEEVKEGSKKLIRRKQEGKRDAGSLLENTITILDLEDSLHKVPDISSYGENRQERLFNLALELSITWINRVLFLKLLEAQLIKYHKGDQSYKFLNYSKISQYDELYKLFFQVLAKKQSDRNDAITKKFGNIPYLNSSLFEISELEDQTIKINSLDDSLDLDLHSGTVLRDAKNKPIAKSLNGLQYLFDFLEAYDFASEGSEEIQEDSKTLINASVLGLIFEKINGYKDGSIFTPGFITMYMCRQAIRLAVLQKFKDAYGWKCEAFEDLKNYMADRRTGKDVLEFNALINSMHLCDPAVGSGHFLVSSLNEIISIKAELGILADDKGVRLSGYDIEIENDELIVTYNDGQDIFEYQVNNGSINKETQRVQKSLFHEKQTIIENCLFGVDINPNSVKICRLRLWIELLKNAYYTEETKFKELETLPNIDINIKCGNSLISRFALDSDLSKALKSIKYNINQYKGFVHDYKNAHDKELKRGLEQIINSIKNDFRVEISNNSKEFKDLSKWKGELINLTMQTGLFEKTPKEKKEYDLEVKKLTEKISKQEALIEDIKSNAIYRNAFEWRFEFPEVLDKEGNFEGFDVVIGNPPYGAAFSDSLKEFYKEYYSNIHVRTPESFNYFISRFIQMGKTKSTTSLIIPSSFLNQIEFEKTRKYLLDNYSLIKVLNLGDDVFNGIAAPTCIISVGKELSENKFLYADMTKLEREKLSVEMNQVDFYLPSSTFKNNIGYNFIFSENRGLINKCYQGNPTLKDIAEEVATGVSPGLGEAFVIKTDDAIKNGFEDEIVKKLIIGGEINRFNISPKSGKGIIYFTNKMEIKNYPNVLNHLKNFKSKLESRVETKSGVIPWYVMLRPRRQKLFESPKILIRQTANRIMAAYDDEKWYCLKSGLIIQLPEESKVSYFYLLGLLNSNLMDFIYRDLVNEEARIFPEVKPVQLFKLPIKVSEDKIQKQVEVYVSKVIEYNKMGKDPLEIEKQIDEMVYKLYDLTEEEIKIVEEN